MKNVRLNLFLAAISIVLGALLFVSEMRSTKASDAAHSRMAVSKFQRSSINGIAIDDRIVLAKRGANWFLDAPVQDEANVELVNRILDLLTLSHYSSSRSFNEIDYDGKTLYDFGLTNLNMVLISAGDKTESMSLGSTTPAGNEVYASIDGMKYVFTVTDELKKICALGDDEFRRNTLCDFPISDITGFELKMPGEPLIKLQSDEGVWKFTLPSAAVADNKVVMKALGRIVSSKVERFMSTNDAQRVKAANDENAISVTIRSGSRTEAFQLHPKVGEKMISVMFNDGKSLGMINENIVEFCYELSSSFKDIPILTMVPDDIMTCSITESNVIYTITRESVDGNWMMVSPVSAKAENNVCNVTLGDIAKLRHVDESADGTLIALVGRNNEKFSTSVRRNAITPGDFRQLRSLQIMALDKNDIEGVVVKGADGAVTNISEEGKAALLNCVSDLKASRIANLEMLPLDFAASGFKTPHCEVQVNLKSAGLGRKTLIVGNESPERDGRYVTGAGSDTIFVVLEETVVILEGKGH